MRKVVIFIVGFVITLSVILAVLGIDLNAASYIQNFTGVAKHFPTIPRFDEMDTSSPTAVKILEFIWDFILWIFKLSAWVMNVVFAIIGLNSSSFYGHYNAEIINGQTCTQWIYQNDQIVCIEF